MAASSGQVLLVLVVSAIGVGRNCIYILPHILTTKETISQNNFWGLAKIRAQEAGLRPVSDHKKADRKQPRALSVLSVGLFLDFFHSPAPVPLGPPNCQGPAKNSLFAQLCSLLCVFCLAG